MTLPLWLCHQPNGVTEVWLCLIELHLQEEAESWARPRIWIVDLGSYKSTHTGTLQTLMISVTRESVRVAETMRCVDQISCHLPPEHRRTTSLGSFAVRWCRVTSFLAHELHLCRVQTCPIKRLAYCSKFSSSTRLLDAEDLGWAWELKPLDGGSLGPWITAWNSPPHYHPCCILDWKNYKISRCVLSIHRLKLRPSTCSLWYYNIWAQMRRRHWKITAQNHSLGLDNLLPREPAVFDGRSGVRRFWKVCV